MTATEHTTAIVELLGHRRLVGQLSEIDFGGATFLRLEIALPGERSTPQMFTSASIFAITPVDPAYVTDRVRIANENALAANSLLGTDNKAAYTARLELEAAERRVRYSLPAQAFEEEIEHEIEHELEADEEEERLYRESRS